MNWQLIVGILFFVGGLGNIASDIGVFTFGVIIGAVFIYWGLIKKGILKNPFLKLFPGNAHNSTERTLQAEIFYLAGVSYYSSNIGKLACSNPAWKYTVAKAVSEGKDGKAIYRYNYVNKPVKLIPEPKNPNDKNAIAVHIAGELVGYIKREENLHVKDILDKHEVKYISSFISGGEYKVVAGNGKFEKDVESIKINIKIAYV